jgi:hypothetical protein
MSQDAGQETIRRCLTVLSEHYDTVDIIVTRLNPDGTTNADSGGIGNWYARFGAAQEFVERQMELIRLEKRRQEKEKE